MLSACYKAGCAVADHCWSRAGMTGQQRSVGSELSHKTGHHPLVEHRAEDNHPYPLASVAFVHISAQHQQASLPRVARFMRLGQSTSVRTSAMAGAFYASSQQQLLAHCLEDDLCHRTAYRCENRFGADLGPLLSAVAHRPL